MDRIISHTQQRHSNHPWLEVLGQLVLAALHHSMGTGGRGGWGQKQLKTANNLVKLAL